MKAKSARGRVSKAEKVGTKEKIPQKSHYKSRGQGGVVDKVKEVREEAFRKFDKAEKYIRRATKKAVMENKAELHKRKAAVRANLSDSIASFQGPIDRNTQNAVSVTELEDSLTKWQNALTAQKTKARTQIKTQVDSLASVLRSSILQHV